jgi:hypothetical protein
VTSLDEEFRQAAVALTPTGVLHRLAGAAAGAGDDLPVVAVHLSGGRVLEGAVIRVGSDRGCEVAVLADRKSGRVSYVLLDGVAAVEVQDPQPFRDVLTGGRLPPPYTGEPVTRLALRREFAPTDEFPVQVDWDAVADGSDQLLGNLARLLAGLRDAVGRVRVDEVGRQTWAQVRVLRVEHRPGAALSVQHEDDGLSVQADLLAALPRSLADALHHQINALL